MVFVVIAKEMVGNREMKAVKSVNVKTGRSTLKLFQISIFTPASCSRLQTAEEVQLLIIVIG